MLIGERERIAPHAIPVGVIFEGMRLLLIGMILLPGSLLAQEHPQELVGQWIASVRGQDTIMVELAPDGLLRYWRVRIQWSVSGVQTVKSRVITGTWAVVHLAKQCRVPEVRNGHLVVPENEVAGPAWWVPQNDTLNARAPDPRYVPCDEYKLCTTPAVWWEDCLEIDRYPDLYPPDQRTTTLQSAEFLSGDRRVLGEFVEYQYVGGRVVTTLRGMEKRD